MKKGRFSWAAFAAYLVPTFPLGYVWHLVAFHEPYQRLDLYRSDVLIPLGVTSMILQGLLFAWLYPRLFDTRRESWLRGALGFGLVFGILAWTFTTLPVAAKYQMTSVPLFLLLESAFTVVQFAVVSPLVALAYRERAVAK